MANFMVLDSSQTALLVIDVQRALFTRPHPVYKDTEMLGVINGLVDRAHLYGIPVIYIQHANDSILKKESDGWKLHPAMKPGLDDYRVHKTKGNAFLEPGLMSVMEARDIKNIVVTGLVTQGCIRATSLGGLKLGYRVFLMKGGHSNYNQDAPDVIEKYQEELENAGVQVVDPGDLAFS